MRWWFSYAKSLRVSNNKLFSLFVPIVILAHWINAVLFFSKPTKIFFLLRALTARSRLLNFIIMKLPSLFQIWSTDLNFLSSSINLILSWIIVSIWCLAASIFFEDKTDSVPKLPKVSSLNLKCLYLQTRVYMIG